MTKYRSFEVWKAEVDKVLAKSSGMVSDDLPDFDYQNSWHSGESPATAARKALRAAKDF